MTLELLDDRPPIPPTDLILRISTSFDPQNIETSRKGFDLSALDHLRSFERGLAAVGSAFTDFERLLDFGCGCGRFLRHFGSLAETVEIHGTDIDGEMVDWCRKNIPFSQLEVAPHEPPLPYPDHHFDLVINHSVFTHLDERLQNLWLAELQRITSPGATLLLTVEGASTFNRTCQDSERAGEDTERWRNELETRGILHISSDAFIGSTHPDFYHSTIHAPWYVFERWTRFFDLAAYVPDGSWTQDLVVLRRRSDGAPQPRPIGHGASEASLPSIASDASPKRQLLADVARAAQRLARRRGAPQLTPRNARSGGPDTEAAAREINMLRAGLYEQGNRISVIAAQLREEMESLRIGK